MLSVVFSNFNVRSSLDENLMRTRNKKAEIGKKLLESIQTYISILQFTSDSLLQLGKYFLEIVKVWAGIQNKENKKYGRWQNLRYLFSCLF